MRKCPRCGHEVQDGEKFCPHCGLDLQGRYRPIQSKNKAMNYLLYVIIFFSFVTIPLFYSRILNSIGGEMTELNQEKIALPKVEEDNPTGILAVYDTLGDFDKQFSDVHGMIQAIENYEASLSKLGNYTFDKKYSIVVLDNYNIYFTLTYSTQINEHLKVSVERQYDRSHTYNTEKVTFEKKPAKSFEELFLGEEDLAIVKTFTGEQTVTDKLMADFKNRQEEFENKKKKLGHYGIGEYDGRSSFVVHRQGETFYSELTYVSEKSEYIH